MILVATGWVSQLVCQIVMGDGGSGGVGEWGSGRWGDGGSGGEEFLTLD